MFADCDRVEAKNCRLVIPKVHDCISIFLGSGDEYDRQAKLEPGQQAQGCYECGQFS